MRHRNNRRRARNIRLELSSVSVDGRNRQLITSINATVYKTNWFKLAIPKALIEEKLAADDSNLMLHIKCFGCKKGAKLVLVHGSNARGRRRKLQRIRKLRRINLRRKLRQKRRKGLRKLIRKKRRKLSRTRPFLLLHTKVKTYFRPKRDADTEGGCSRRDRCCMEPFEFNFADSDVGWDDWVISPPSFRTAFCGGNCIMPYSNCTATRHKSLKIIYYDQSGSIILRRVPNMVVTACGCST